MSATSFKSLIALTFFTAAGSLDWVSPPKALCQNPTGAPVQMRLYKSFPMTRTKKSKLVASKPSAPEPISASASAALSRARVLEKANDYSRAITVLTVALKNFPASKELYVELGACYIHERRLNDALVNANLALTKCAPAAAIYKQRAEANYLLHDYSNTLKDLESAGKLRAPTSDDYFTRANCFSNLGNPKAVIENVGSGLKLDPKNADAYYLRAKTYKNLNQNALAEADFARAMSLQK